MLQPKQISLIIPCFNEEKNIELLYKKITETTNKNNKSIKFKFVFIDDGSKDNTWQIIESLTKSDSNILGLKLSRNFGKENALLAGIDQAPKSDAYISLDADLQDDPSIINDMIDYFIDGNDIVYGQRVSRDDNALYAFFTMIFYYIMNRATNINIPKNVADFYLFSNKVRTEFLNMQESVRYTRGLIFYTGFKRKSVMYHRTKRTGGKSSFNLIKLIKLAIDAITGFSTTPLHLISFIGATTSVITFIGIILYVASSYIFNLNLLSGWSSIILITGFYGSIQLLFLSIISEYVARISVENKHRTKYIVEEYRNQSEK